MLKKIFLALLGLIAIYAITCFFGPKRMDVTTTKTISGLPEQVYAQIIDYRNWPNWSKWIKEDTAMKIVYDKNSSGIGSGYSWTSEKSGSGSMKTTEAVPNSLFKADLNFKDYNSTSKVVITLKPSDNQTVVTWSMRDENPIPFFYRGMMLFMNMNDAIVRDFDKGLANLDEFIKSGKAGTYLNGYTILESNFPGGQYLGKRAKLKFAEIGKFFETHYPVIAKLASDKISGPPSGIYWQWDEKNQTTDMAAVMPVSLSEFLNDTYKIISVPSSKEFVIDYYGDYQKTQNAYKALDSMLSIKGITHPEMVIEEYISDPMLEKDTAKWLTKIHFLVK